MGKQIIHICSDYSRQRLYPKLARKLFDGLGLAQVWFVPVRTQSEIGFGKDPENRFHVVQVLILRRIHRWFYHRKLAVVLNAFKANVPLDNASLVHAHFLFSDGGVAYNLKKETGLRYVVSVRNTDINVFFKYAFHLHGFIRRVLREAESIVLINPDYKNKLKNQLGSKLYNELSPKMMIIPNLLEQDWFRTASKSKTLGQTHLVYVGDNTPNKRFSILLDILRGLPKSFCLTYIGITHDDVEIPYDLRSRVTVLGKIETQEELIEILDKHDIFMLPSKHETFGMAAAEAMARRLPVIIQKGEGLSGFLNGELHLCSVNYESIDEVKEVVLEIAANFELYSRLTFETAQTFSQTTVLTEYAKLYKT